MESQLSEIIHTVKQTAEVQKEVQHIERYLVIETAHDVEIVLEIRPRSSPAYVFKLLALGLYTDGPMYIPESEDHVKHPGIHPA